MVSKEQRYWEDVALGAPRCSVASLCHPVGLLAPLAKKEVSR